MSNAQSAAYVIVVAAFTIQNLDDRYQTPYGVNLAIQSVNRVDRRGAETVILTN